MGDQMIMERNIKGLKEILLKCAAINLRQVFSDFIKDNSTSYYGKLSPGLFEEIILKGREICWHINIDILEGLLPYRDKLQWERLDIILNQRTNLRRSDTILKLVCEVAYPVKTLCIQLEKVTEEDMRRICSFGNTLECLELWHSDGSLPKSLNSFFPKLQRLSLGYLGLVKPSLDIDITSFTDKLEELKIENYAIDVDFIKSITTLKKLKKLSLVNIYGKDNRFDFPFEIFAAMKNLSILDLRSNIFNYSRNLSNAFSKLTNLKKLDLSFAQFMLYRSEELKSILRNGNLEKSSFFSLPDDFDTPMFNVFNITDEEVPFSEMYVRKCDNYLQGSIRNVSLSIPNISTDQKENLEKVLLSLWEEAYSSPIFVHYIVKAVKEYINSHDASNDFITKLISLICSTQDANLSWKLLNQPEFKALIGSTQVVRRAFESIRQDLNKRFDKRL